MTERLFASDGDIDDIRARDAHARERGVTGVPTFVIANQHVVAGRSTNRALDKGAGRTGHRRRGVGVSESLRHPPDTRADQARGFRLPGRTGRHPCDDVGHRRLCNRRHAASLSTDQRGSERRRRSEPRSVDHRRLHGRPWGWHPGQRPDVRCRRAAEGGPLGIGADRDLRHLSLPQLPALNCLLIARFVQGIGSSGPRVAAMAIVRDLFRWPRDGQDHELSSSSSSPWPRSLHPPSVGRWPGGLAGGRSSCHSRSSRSSPRDGSCCEHPKPWPRQTSALPPWTC